MSLLRYAKVVSKPSNASTSASGSQMRGSSIEQDGDHHVSDKWLVSECSPPKRLKMVSDCKLSASEIDAILTAEVPDLGLFSIAKLHNSAATHDRLKKILKSRFVPSKTWVAPKRQCGQKKCCVSADLFNKEMYPCIRYSVTRDALYCVVCTLFGTPKKNLLTTEPLTDWSNARRLISKHEKTSDHKFAQQRSIDFYECDKEQLGIAHHMSKSQYEFNGI